jgi:hypothetical protein
MILGSKCGSAGLALVALGTVVVAGLALPATAKDAKSEATIEKQRPPVVDPRAEQVLREMGAYLAAAKQFTVRADIRFDHVLPTGQKVQLSAVEDVAVRRPDKLYAEYDGDVGAKRFWYDGKDITMYDEDANVEATAAVPGEIDSMLDYLLKKYDFSPPLADFVYSDPYAILAPHAQLGLYLGEHVVDGVRCHHLAFVDPTIDWQVWVEDGSEIVPRKVVITYKMLPESPQFEAVLSHWDFDARLANARFVPMLPPGVPKIDFLPTALGPAGESKK